ncbi:PREDICTED: myb-like protein X [Tarenaya hassleriana]|uniref:myb-like protein X n=1 Tax=Tarenaya hassleriana TaxID=28532 RepID=UPI00053C3D06|nr:PREDICTED: myb-like protein X [Tarenaya hassleriana]XP_010547937.1 PREDICTED: myb-like protein X [Tarenaya hassleriana]
MMMKKTSSRNQRANKGIKWKLVLQICVLAGVCVWLIYQVKYSHDKKREFYEKDEGASTENGVVKLGRKDIPHLRDVNGNEQVVEDEDEDITGEEEISHGGEKEMKSEVVNDHPDDEEEGEEEEIVEEEEEKNKQGEENDNEEEENKQMGDDDDDAEDDIDEHDEGKPRETDREDEILEEEKEREGENSEEGSESNRRDEEEGRKDGDGNISDETDTTVHGAREEHYKADDASSAVSHESHTEKGSSGNSDTNVVRDAIELNRDSNNTEMIGLAEGKGESFGSDTRREADNSNSTVTSLEGSGLVQNRTESTVDPRQEHNKTESVGTPEEASKLPRDPEKNEFDPAISVSSNTTKEDSIEARSLNTASDSVVLEKIKLTNTTEAKENSGSPGDDDESGNKKSSDLSSAKETGEKVDSSGNTISREEKEALSNPQTLPEIRTEGTEHNAVAAE